MPRGGPGPLQDQRPADQKSDDGDQHGRQSLKETKTILPIGFAPWERTGWRFSLESRAVLAREVVAVQAHLGRERPHVRPSEHPTGKAGEVVVLNGRERGH